jgi:hypothetical protein
VSNRELGSHEFRYWIMVAGNARGAAGRLFRPSQGIVLHFLFKIPISTRGVRKADHPETHMMLNRKFVTLGIIGFSASFLAGFFVIFFAWTGVATAATVDLTVVQAFDFGDTHLKISTDKSGSRMVSIDREKSGYHELDFDLAGNGVIDVKEVSTPTYLVRLSVPSRRGYRRLEIDKRLSKGVQTADFVLSRDGSNYVLIGSRFVAFRQMHDETHDEVSSDGSGCVRDAGAPQAGNGAVNSAVGQDIQIEYAIDPTCKVYPFQEGLPALRKDISAIVSEPMKGQLMSCMSSHQAGYFAGKMDDAFQQMLAPNAPPVVACNQVSYPVIASYSEESGKITIDRVTDPVTGKIAPQDNGPAFFHESLHKAGIANEQLVLQIVACCYQGKDAEACKKVDKTMQSQEVLTAHFTAYSQDLAGFPKLWGLIEKNSDPATADVILQDYLDMFQKLKGSAQGNTDADFSACLKKGGGTEASCSQQAMAEAMGSTTEFLEQNCPRYFQSAHQDFQQICADIKKQTTALVTENATHACRDPKTPGTSGAAVTDFKQSCLMTAEADVNTIQKELDSEKPHQKDAPNPLTGSMTNLADNDNARQNQKRVALLDSYLTSFSSKAALGGGVMAVFSAMKEEIGPEVGVAMMEAWFKQINADQPQKQFAAILAKGGGAGLRIQVDAGIHDFFSKTCPRYFTQASEKSSIDCTKYADEFVKLVDQGIGGQCQNKLNAALISGGLNFNCLSNAFTQGAYYVKNYAKVKSTLIHGTDEQWEYATWKGKKDAGQSVANAPGGGPAGAARGLGGGSGVNGVNYITFNPEDADQGTAKRWAVNQMDSGATTVATAARAMASAAVASVGPREAQAAAPVAQSAPADSVQFPSGGAYTISTGAVPSAPSRASAQSSNPGQSQSVGASAPRAPGAHTEGGASPSVAPTATQNVSLGATPGGAARAAQSARSGTSGPGSAGHVDSGAAGAPAVIDDNAKKSGGHRVTIVGPDMALMTDPEVMEVSMRAKAFMDGLRGITVQSQRDWAIAHFMASPQSEHISVTSCRGPASSASSSEPWVKLKQDCRSDLFDKWIKTKAGWYKETPGGMEYE